MKLALSRRRVLCALGATMAAASLAASAQPAASDRTIR